MTRILLALFLLVGIAAAPPAVAGDPKVVPGQWNKRDIPAGWVVIETEHYHVQCQAGKAKAERLAQHLESMWAVYADFLPTRRKPDTFVLKLFKDRPAFQAYSPEGTKGALAYYNQSSMELVGYDTGVILGERDIPAIVSLKEGAAARFTPTENARLAQLFEAATDANTMDAARILGHEGWHQYFHMYTVSIVPMPSWLDEGIGDYFFMATRDPSSENAHGYRLGALNEHRVRALQRALVDGTTVSFETLLGFAQEDYYKNPGVYYAQGWSMVQFLMHNEQSAYHELIPKLLKDFKASKNFVKSTEKIFKGLDLQQLDRDWIAWVTTLKVDDPLRTLATEFGDRLPAKDLASTEEKLPVIYQWHLDHPGELFGN